MPVSDAPKYQSLMMYNEAEALLPPLLTERAMAPPNILNLDDYRVTRSVIINGKERVVRNMTVEQFIAAADIEKRLAATSSEREQIPILVEVVAQYVEEIGRAHV